MVGKFARIFPTIGKIFRRFSNDWKKFSAGGRRSCGEDGAGAVAFGEVGAGLVEEVGVEAGEGVGHPRGIDFHQLGYRVGTVGHVLDQPRVDRADVPIARHGVAAGGHVVEIPLRQRPQRDEVRRHLRNRFTVEHACMAVDAPQRLLAKPRDDLRTAQLALAPDVFDEAADVEEIVVFNHWTPPRLSETTAPLPPRGRDADRARLEAAPPRDAQGRSARRA